MNGLSLSESNNLKINAELTKSKMVDDTINKTLHLK